MKAKDKAYQLYERFFTITPEELTNDECVEFAKKCALIAIDEIMMECSNWTGGSMDNGWDIKRFDYWQEVKKEIEKL